MRKPNLLFIAAAAAITCLPSLGQVYQGYIDGVSCASISGWAWNSAQPNTPISVDIYDGRVPVATVIASNYRADLYAAGYGNGDHGYSFAVPPSLMDGQTHVLYAYVSTTNINVGYNGALNCVAGSTGYQYYYNDSLTSINSSKWTQNGTVTATSSGLTGTSANGGSLISSVAVPDGTSDYEVKTTLDITQGGGTFVAYLRATSNAKTGPSATGTFYSLEITPSTSNPNFIGMVVNKSIAGVVTQILAIGVNCHNGSTVRFAIRGAILTIATDNQEWYAFTDHSITSGQPGVGAFGTPSGNSISAVNIGPADRLAPQAPNSATFETSVLPNRVDFRMAPTPDDANGTGIGYYVLLRNGNFLAGTHAPEFSDETVSPSTTYTYSIYSVDFHYNLSPTTNFTVTTPPASSVDPRRVGVRPTGAYWGATPEQIDVLSGNLNLTLPLLNAQLRGSGSVPFNLTYNSQSWRKDSGGTWNLGADVGYGYGWKLQAGSLVPFFTSWWAIDHYLFTDATGAEYRLDQYNSSTGLWTSKESLYVWYAPGAGVLHFRDGSSWAMGCTSAGSEPDAGTMYPTTIEDSNGNQILVYYNAAQGFPTKNTSARISYIQDVRAISVYPVYETYYFFYTVDVVPHLVNIQNAIATSEGYQFAFYGAQNLIDPFTGTNYLYTGGLVGLQSVTATGIGMQHSFTYDQSGEMTQAVFPYGGYFKYNYGSVTYSSGFTQREVSSRIMSKDGTLASEISYPFTHESPTNTQPVHQYTTMADPGGVGQKHWVFSQSGSNIGLVTSYQGQQLPGPTTLTQNDFTWSQDANSNFYIGSTLNTFNSGMGTAQSKVSQTVDIYGNVTQVQKFAYGSLSTPARTYNYTYVNSGNYVNTSRFIFNRLLTASVTDGTNTVYLAQNGYDTNFQYVPPFTTNPQEWDTSYVSQTYRGNLTSSTTPDGTYYYSYDQAGNLAYANINGVNTSVTTNTTTNFAAPSQLTTGSLSNSMTYTSFLGLSNSTGANGDSVSTAYDTFARPVSTTSPFGATTTYTYNSPPFSSTTPATVTMTTNGRRTKNTLDGFGRTVKVEISDANNTYSSAESVYGPCACSPLGKLVQQSMPHVPGASSPTWTTYTYDGVGRTLSAATVGSDTQGTTTYAYNYISTNGSIQVTDPVGNYKRFATDIFNHVIIVAEPGTPSDPGGEGTYYGYDLLDHLTSVYMARTAGTQNRSFVYSGNNLMSAANPENGTVNYTYNSLNKMATKTDAKGQQVQYTYDTYGRLTQVHRFIPQSGQLVEDACQKEVYSYDTNPYDSTYSGYYTAGRLTAVQYFTPTLTGCVTTFTEMYSYSQAGAKTGKRLQVTRSGVSVNLDSSYTYDNEGRTTAVQYPAYYQAGYGQQAGPNIGYGFDTLGRLYTMTDLATQSAIVSATSYGPSNELLAISGQVTETRTYNSMVQLVSLVASASSGPSVNLSYAYPSTQNTGKITSQTDHISGEQVVYTYDALNRLASATATNNSWGQSYSYDGFGNLTDQNVTVGSAPTYHVVPNASTNHLGGEDANGNASPLQNGGFDVENRLKWSYDYNGSSITYGYAPGNKRVWRQVTTTGTVVTDEITFWSVSGRKLATYQLVTNSGVLAWATQTATYYWFGGKLVKNAGGYVASDRLGSNGHFYPYGQEKPSATQNGTEKFTGYLRDSDTGLDYADQRYHNPGTGRFLTPDQNRSSAGLMDPGRWNRYAYVGGDPVSRIDPTGNDWCDPFEEGYGILPCDGSGVGGMIGADSGSGCLTADSFGEIVSIDCNTLLLLNWATYGTAPDAVSPPPCSISFFERGVPFGASPAQHTYLDISDPANGISVVLEGGPTNPHNPVRHRNAPWGNLVGYVDPINIQTGTVTGGLPGTNPATNQLITSVTGGRAVCSEVDTLLSNVQTYNHGAVPLSPYSPVPKSGSGTANSNSFTFTLLFDVGLTGMNWQPVGWAPGWGIFVPGL